MSKEMYLLYLFSGAFGLVHGLSNCSYQVVQEYLGLNEDNIKMTSLRPVLHWKTPTLASVDLYISSIVDVNEKAQTFSPLAYLEMSWVNEFTKWKPADFCGTTVISVPKKMLWIPDVTILEAIKTEFSTQESPFLKLQSQGTVTVAQAYTMTASCKMDLHRFPFDTQSCSLTLQSYLHNIEEFKIEAYSNASILTQSSKQFFQTQGEWDLVSINMSKTQLQASDRTWDQLTYTITIKRRPLLYVVIFLLPILYFLVLDLASFYIDDEGGEKFSFKVTILLAISVLLLILHDMLPSTSDKLPLIGIYCSSIFTFTAVSLLETIFVTYLKTCKVVPFAKLCGETISLPDFQNTGEMAPQVVEMSAGNSRQDLDHSITVLHQILTELRTVEQYISTVQTQRQKKTTPWTKVAKVINRAFFIMYLHSVIIFLQQIWKAWFP